MSSTRRRAAIAALSVAALALLLVALATTRPPAPDRDAARPGVPFVQGPPQQPGAPRHPQVDPQDADPVLRARMLRDVRRRPALQHLPFTGEAITINLADVDRAGRPVLIVRYATTLAQARAAYRRWLAYWRDDPSRYRTLYRRVASSPFD